jgi:type IV pilus assembly protein PilC
LEPADAGLLALGAESGTLEQVLGGLAAHHRRRERLARETLALLTRPILTFLIAVVLGSSLVLFLPDKLTRTLREQITFPLGPREPSARERFQARLEGRAALPAPPERWRLYLNLVSLPTGALALLVVGGCFGAAVAQALPGGGRLTSTAAVMTPIFGPALRLQAQARFLDALALGIAAGAPLLRSLKLAADAMASPALAAPIERARDDLLRGRGLAEALRDRRALPAELIDRIAMAESLGTFDAALAASARELEQRAEERLRSAAMALQPLTFFLVALYFLGLLIAILGSALSAALSKG